jgi:hypothetical protein
LSEPINLFNNESVADQGEQTPSADNM